MTLNDFINYFCHLYKIWSHYTVLVALLIVYKGNQNYYVIHNNLDFFYSTSNGRNREENYSKKWVIISYFFKHQYFIQLYSKSF